MSELKHHQDLEEEEFSHQEERDMTSDCTDPYMSLIQSAVRESLFCHICEKHFTNSQELEQHACSDKTLSSNVNHLWDEERDPLVSTGSVIQQNEPEVHKEKLCFFLKDNSQILVKDASELQTQPGKHEEPAEQNMLNISSNISEDLTFYIDGKMVSTSNCEVSEGHCESSAVVGLDVLTGNPTQISSEPKTRTELESEIASSPSSFVSPLIENSSLNSESTEEQKQRAGLLPHNRSQEGLNPSLTVITDGQKPSSPVSFSVLPSGRFKRRTSSPTTFPNTDESVAVPDAGDVVSVNTGLQGSCTQHTTSDNMIPCVGEQAPKPVLMDTRPSVTGGNSCNQRPLDLSNTVKTNDSAALDLSLQKSIPGGSELALHLGKKAVKETGKGGLEPPMITLVTASDIVTPVEPVPEGLVYGLTLSPPSLAPPSASLAPIALESASPCTIAFASPVAHAMLPTAPSLITVLAPPPVSNQPIQVMAPNISPEPMVICTENPLNSPCDLAAAFATTNSANIVTLSQPLNPALHLPGHVLLDSSPVSEVPLAPSVNLTDSLFSSYNIASNAVLIECTIALDGPRAVVPAAVNPQEKAADFPIPTQLVVNQMKLPNLETVDPSIPVSSTAESLPLSADTEATSGTSIVRDSSSDAEPDANPESPAGKDEDAADESVAVSENAPEIASSPAEKAAEPSHNTTDVQEEQTFTKNFICNVCDKLFHSMKELGHHVGDHADEWPYKCEFCVLLFGKPSALLDHRSSLHGVGKTYVCSACTKEFVYLCNLKQHQEELHPGQSCTYTEDEKGKLRPQNYNNSTKVNTDPLAAKSLQEPSDVVKKEKSEVDVAAEELFTTIKIMASDGGKVKGPDVRLGIYQHYPSFKPPPFPYHNRSPAGSVASATNFTTHNIPQTFTTAIRCTKCGKSFDNMPELHNHILACANASDKRRYTPRKNPVPLRHFSKSQNGVLWISSNGLKASIRVSPASRSKPGQEAPVKLRILSKKKKKLVQRVMPQRNKSVSSSNKASSPQVESQQEVFVCPHCSREFTMRRSRTKHMAVCPKKPAEVTKRKEGGISVTKENDHLHRGVSRVNDKQSSPPHKTRHQTSGSAKRHAILPVQAVFPSKRSKISIKELAEPKQESPTLTEIPIRTFNPSMRQYSRMQQNVRVPVKISVVRPQQTVQERDAPTPSKEEAGRAVTRLSEQSTSV
ncbi:PR domain zinc finger protein 2 [Oryzias melastigma]|uniref:PR domain zinc finger protein 2 n=1 Tax=Oryzias melastigma TaxID=30732 RepID=UPI000CF7F81E|nr:PR domain zinc finger protein 2 [Oryzias melastigma]